MQAVVGFGVDGKMTTIPNQTSTVGVGFCYGSAGGLCGVSVAPVEFQVSGSTSHSFYLSVFTNSATATFPNSQLTGFFACREVPSR